MWEEKRGWPERLNSSSSAEIMPSSQGRSFLLQRLSIPVRTTQMLASGANSRAVVGVEDDGNAVDGGNGADVVGGSNGTGDGSLLLVGRVGDGLAGEVGGTALGTGTRQNREQSSRW